MLKIKNINPNYFPKLWKDKNKKMPLTHCVRIEASFIGRQCVKSWLH